MRFIKSKFKKKIILIYLKNYHIPENTLKLDLRIKIQSGFCNRTQNTTKKQKQKQTVS
jgi:hypothetical protein